MQVVRQDKEDQEKKPVEFGGKISASIYENFVFLDN